MAPSATTNPTAAPPLPSSQRCEPGSVNIPVAKWPPTASDGPVDALAITEGILSQFNAHLARAPSDPKEAAAGVASLFVDGDCYWRDHLALSWDLRTLKTRDNIAAFLQDRSSSNSDSNRNDKSNISNLSEIALDTSTERRAPKVAPLNPEGTCRGIVAYLTFASRVGGGHGYVRLVQQEGGADGGGGGWRIWTLFTTLEELRGFEEPVGARRPQGVNHGYHHGRKNWLDRRHDEENFVDSEPDVLIIGAGQAGLTAHARLKMLNVRALIIDANERVGDNWRKRYHQLVLHDPVWYDHLPYLPFPDWWPVFTPKDKLADFFEAYARLLDLNVWTRAAVRPGSAAWDPAARRWTVTVDRSEGEEGPSSSRVLRPRHIILATGHSGKANIPSIPGADAFAGDLLTHSSGFPGARPPPPQQQDGADGATTRQQRRAVVVGACNSAHDICQDYVENGYHVTMVQRSTTCVVSSASICRYHLGGSYEEGGPPTEDADLAAWATPAEVLKAAHRELTARQQDADGATLRGLEAAGFRVDRGPDDCGLYLKYFQRGGGYYIDVGASRLIAEGRIAVAQGREVAEVLPRALRLSDGTELPADEIVFATGYQNMRTQARAIFGDAVADRLGDIWGFDEGGEFRALWRDSGHPGFWFHGGNLAVCRYYSRILALQIKAQLEGLDKV